MKNGLIDLVLDLKETSDDKTAWDVAEHYFKSLQFGVVNCAIIERKDSTLVGFFSNMTEDWMNHYMEAEYYVSDPWIRHIFDCKPDGIYLQENKTLFASTRNTQAHRLFMEVEGEGIRSSVISPLQNSHSDKLMGTNLGSELRSDEFVRHVEAYQAEIFVGLALVQNHLFSVSSDIKDKAPWFPGRSTENILTPREREVLLWLAQGLRTDRISAKMNIANVTVNFHIQSIKQKLDVKTREHAIAVAVGRNLIDP